MTHHEHPYPEVLHRFICGLVVRSRDRVDCFCMRDFDAAPSRLVHFSERGVGPCDVAERFSDLAPRDGYQRSLLSVTIQPVAHRKQFPCILIPLHNRELYAGLFRRKTGYIPLMKLD